MAESTRPDHPVDRRRVLGSMAMGVAGLVGAVATAGCGIHVDRDGPALPFLPRAPIPAEKALVALTGECAALARLSRAAGTTPLLTQLATLHARQHDVLVTALRARGVPEGELAAASTASPTPSGPLPPSGPTASPNPSVSPGPTTLAALAGAEAAGLDGRIALASADLDLRPTVCALLAQRYAASALLGGPVPALPAAGAPPRDIWAAPRDAVPVLAATRSAEYAFEVVAAQSGPEDRARARTGLATVTELVVEQSASLGPDAPPAPLGYPLPFTVTNPGEARRLAAQVTTRLRAAYGAALGPLTRVAAPATVDHLPWWLGRAEVLAHTWGADLQPFPGLS